MGHFFVSILHGQKDNESDVRPTTLFLRGENPAKNKALVLRSHHSILSQTLPNPECLDTLTGNNVQEKNLHHYSVKRQSPRDITQTVNLLPAWGTAVKTKARTNAQTTTIQTAKEKSKLLQAHRLGKAFQ